MNFPGLQRRSLKKKRTVDAEDWITLTLEDEKLSKLVISRWKTNQQKVFKQWKMYDDLATLFCFLGLLLSIVFYEIDILQKDQKTFVLTPRSELSRREKLEQIRREREREEKELKLQRRYTERWQANVSGKRTN